MDALLRELIADKIKTANDGKEKWLGSVSDKYLCLNIHDVSDPDQALRQCMHGHQPPYDLKPGGLLELEALERIQPYNIQECMALISWFTVNVKPPYKVDVLPRDELFMEAPDLADKGGPQDVFSQLKSIVTSQNSQPVPEDLGVTAVVFICRVDSTVVNFERFLHKCLQKYSDKKQVICVFHAENLTNKKIPKLRLDGCRVNLFSAFDPGRYPVSVVLAKVEKASM